MIGYSLLSICLYCLVAYTQGASYGEYCKPTNDCIDAYQTCDSTCRCITPGYTVNGAGTQCVGYLGYACETKDNCADPAALCTSDLCSCNTTTHYDSNGPSYHGKCNTKKELGETCSDTVLCRDDNSVCNGNKCVCATGYYGIIGGVCIPKKRLGQTCPNPTTNGVPSTSSCDDNNAVCQQVGTTKQYACRCKSSYYDDNGDSVDSGKCIIKAVVGQTCPEPTLEVPNTATCADSSATCEYYGNGEYKCICPDGYYDNNGANSYGGQCVLITDTETSEDKSDVTVVIVGVVLGVIIVILVIYSVFVSFKLRRVLANKDGAKSGNPHPTYVNEVFQNVAVTSRSTDSTQGATPDYLTLTDDTRSEISTYDSIRG